jgi:hypothetical protein
MANFIRAVATRQYLPTAHSNSFAIMLHLEGIEQAKYPVGHDTQSKK